MGKMTYDPNLYPALAAEEARREKNRGQLWTGIIMGVLILSCGICVKNANKEGTSAKTEALYQAREAEKAAVDECVREGQTRDWCKDRLEILKRTGR